METGALDPRDIQTIVQSLYRLFRVGGFHLLDNDAVTLATEDTLRSLGTLRRFDQKGITLVFAEDTVIVNGQLLQADPEVYESAMDFSAFLSDIETNAISIQATVSTSDLRALLELFRDRDRASELLGDDGALTSTIHLRRINPALLLGLEDDRLSVLDRVLLTYALTVLVMRRLFESVADDGFELAGYFKRLSRQLARVNYVDRPVVFDVILARYLDADDAKRAVNAAILSIAMARRTTEHEVTLSRIAMAALLLPVGRYRRYPNPDHRADLPVSSAIVNMAMGELFGDNLERTIVAWEAQRLQQGIAASELYPDENQPSFESRIVHTAHRCIALLIDSGDIDGTLETLLEESADAIDRVALALLIDAIGVLPRGTVVELDSGCRGIVTAAGRRPTAYARPTVRVLVDERGRTVPAADIDLDDATSEAARHGGVARVVHHPSAVLKAATASLGGKLPTWLARRAADESETRELFDLEDAQRGRRASPGESPAAARTMSVPAVSPDEFDERTPSARTGSAFERIRSTLRTTGAPAVVETDSGFERRPSSVRRTTGGFDRSPSGVRRTTGGFERAGSSVRRSTGDFERSPSGLRRAVEGSQDDHGFDRSPSSVSRLHRTARGDRGAAAEFRRRASTGRHRTVPDASPVKTPRPGSEDPVTPRPESGAPATPRPDSGPRPTGAHPAPAAGAATGVFRRAGMSSAPHVVPATTAPPAPPLQPTRDAAATEDARPQAVAARPGPAAVSETTTPSTPADPGTEAPTREKQDSGAEMTADMRALLEGFLSDE